MFEVIAHYLAIEFPWPDARITEAAGRESDFAGIGGEVRDLGWICSQHDEAISIGKRITGLGYVTFVREKRSREGVKDE